MNIKFVISGLGLAVVLGLGMTFAEGKLDAVSVVANAVAKTVCTCVFVVGRDLEDCAADNPPGFDLAVASLDEREQAVHSSVYWVVRGTAHYEGDVGCVLE